MTRGSTSAPLDGKTPEPKPPIAAPVAPPAKPIIKDRRISRPYRMEQSMFQWWIKAREVMIDLGCTSRENAMKVREIIEFVPHASSRMRTADDARSRVNGIVNGITKYEYHKHFGIGADRVSENRGGHAAYVLWVKR